MYQDCVKIQGSTAERLAENLSASPAQVVARYVKAVMDFAAERPAAANKSWPSLLKSMAFFNEVVGYMQGMTRRNEPNTGTQHSQPEVWMILLTCVWQEHMY